MTFTPRADESYDVRAVDATGTHERGHVHRAAGRRRPRADRAATRPERDDPPGERRSAPVRDVGGAGRAPDGRRRAAGRLARRGTAAPATSATPYRRAMAAGREPRPRHPHDAVARRRPGAAERAVGVPVRAAALPRQPAPHADRAPARDGLDGAGTRHRRRRADPRDRRQPARPRPARRRRRAPADHAGAGAGGRGRAGPPRLARAGVAARASAWPFATATTTSSTTSGTATSRPPDPASSTSRTPTTGSSVEVDETLFANLLSDQNVLRLVVLNSCEGARTTLTDPYAGVATTLVQLGVPAVVAMQFEISDRAAIVFAEELYTNLIGRRDPIDASVAEARKAIYSDVDRVEWATPVLFVRDPDVAAVPLRPGAAAAGPDRRPPTSSPNRELEPDAAPVPWWRTLLKPFVARPGGARAGGGRRVPAPAVRRRRRRRHRHDDDHARRHRQRRRWRSRRPRSATTGRIVLAMQRLLNEHGHPAPQTGFFDDATEEPCEHLEEAANIPPDGTVGRVTWQQLAVADPPRRLGRRRARRRGAARRCSASDCPPPTTSSRTAPSRSSWTSSAPTASPSTASSTSTRGGSCWPSPTASRRPQATAHRRPPRRDAGDGDRRRRDADGPSAVTSAARGSATGGRRPW